MLGNVLKELTVCLSVLELSKGFSFFACQGLAHGLCFAIHTKKWIVLFNMYITKYMDAAKRNIYWKAQSIFV